MEKTSKGKAASKVASKTKGDPRNSTVIKKVIARKRKRPTSKVIELKKDERKNEDADGARAISPIKIARANGSNGPNGPDGPDAPCDCKDCRAESSGFGILDICDEVKLPWTWTTAMISECALCEQEDCLGAVILPVKSMDHINKEIADEHFEQFGAPICKTCLINIAEKFVEVANTAISWQRQNVGKQAKAYPGGPDCNTLTVPPVERCIVDAPVEPKPEGFRFNVIPRHIQEQADATGVPVDVPAVARAILERHGVDVAGIERTGTAFLGKIQSAIGAIKDAAGLVGQAQQGEQPTVPPEAFARTTFDPAVHNPISTLLAIKATLWRALMTKDQQTINETLVQIVNAIPDPLTPAKK